MVANHRKSAASEASPGRIISLGVIRLFSVGVSEVAEGKDSAGRGIDQSSCRYGPAQVQALTLRNVASSDQNNVGSLRFHLSGRPEHHGDDSQQQGKQNNPAFHDPLLCALKELFSIHPPGLLDRHLQRGLAYEIRRRS